MKIIIATRNQGKMVEVKQILSDLPVKFVSLDDLDSKINISEEGKTFQENALSKARQVCDETNEWVLADDSGLCIQSLDDQPGVMTARWAGVGATDEQLVRHTLDAMNTIEPDRRQAFFECAVALVAPDGQEWVFTGRVDGVITATPRGESLPGLPYDRIFVPNGYEQTFSELDATTCNELKHRGQALAKLKRFIIQAELIEAASEPIEIQAIHSQEQAA
jgi:XTP/dITP diphosphohydrolase